MTASSEPAERLDVNSAQGEAIVAAAMRCFDTWGVERTRMGDIATEADIARPTVYRYFPNKEALVLEVMIRHIRAENAKIRKRIRLVGTGRDVILRCLLLQFREQRPKEQPGSLLRTEPTHKLARRTATSPEVLQAAKELWADILAYAAERGELRADLDVDGAIRWMTMLVHVSLALPELMPGDDQLEAYLDKFVVQALVR